MNEKEDITSSNGRLYSILQAKDRITISVTLIFLTDLEWSKLIEHQLTLDSEEWRDEAYKNYVRKETRAFEVDGNIYFKDSARKAEDFRRLLLHELGHAVCDFYHVDRDGDIMNSNWRKWYGCKKEASK